MRVRRTLAFLDLCGFTAFTDSHGDDEAVGVLGQLRAIVREQAERYGVRVTKWLGDGVMLSGVEQGPVIACAADIRDAVQRDGRLDLRGGICRGDVIMFEGDDYIGAAVNVAARLCRLASPGQLLITDSLVAAVPRSLGTVRLGAVTIEGVARPVEVLALETKRVA